MWGRRPPKDSRNTPNQAKKNETEGVSFLMKPKSTIKGGMSLTIQKEQELSFSFRLQARCITKKKKKNMRRLFDKKGNEFNAWEIKEKLTRATNINMERDNQLMKMSSTINMMGQESRDTNKVIRPRQTFHIP